MTPALAYQQVDAASAVLDWIRSRLDDEERQHLALELLDVTRRGNGYERVIGSWALMVVTREHPDYARQIKEFRNLESSGELFEGTSIDREMLSREPRRAILLAS